MIEEMYCVNHPKTETALRCSSCGDPICVKCSHQSAVGMKCPDCARLPRSARRVGKPRHVALGTLAAFGAGAGVSYALELFRFGLVLLPLLGGWLVGEAAVRASSGLKQGPIRPLAAIGAALGVVALVVFVGLPLTGPRLLRMVLVGGMVVFRMSR